MDCIHKGTLLCTLKDLEACLSSWAPKQMNVLISFLFSATEWLIEATQERRAATYWRSLSHQRRLTQAPLCSSYCGRQRLGKQYVQGFACIILFNLYNSTWGGKHITSPSVQMGNTLGKSFNYTLWLRFKTNWYGFKIKTSPPPAPSVFCPMLKIAVTWWQSRSIEFREEVGQTETLKPHRLPITFFFCNLLKFLHFPKQRHHLERQCSKQGAYGGIYSIFMAYITISTREIYSTFKP